MGNWWGIGASVVAHAPQEAEAPQEGTCSPLDSPLNTWLPRGGQEPMRWGGGRRGTPVQRLCLCAGNMICRCRLPAGWGRKVLAGPRSCGRSPRPPLPPRGPSAGLPGLGRRFSLFPFVSFRFECRGTAAPALVSGWSKLALKRRSSFMPRAPSVSPFYR